MTIFKRIAIDFFLIAIFAGLIFLIAMPFLAEIEFNTATKLIEESKWDKAELKFEKAVKIDPFSSQYISGYADFLLRRSSEYNDKESVFARSESLYAEAARINPRCADYYLGMGQAEMGLFLNDKKTYASKLKAALDNFKKATENDPNGFNIAYSIGYTGMIVWKFLAEDEQEFVFERFAYSLNSKPWYARYIYPHLWKHTKNIKLLRRITPKKLELEKYLDYFLSENKEISGGK